MSERLEESPRLFKAVVPAYVVGGVALVVCAIGWFFDAGAFYRAYLYAWIFFVGVALGSMSVVMLHHLTGGAWGWLVRRPAESAAMTLPLLFALFIPIAIGLPSLYPWANASDIAEEALLRHRHVFFNTSFALVRVVLYFALWTLWAWRLRRLSLRHDESQDASLLPQLRAWSAAGLVVYFITMSLAAVDWVGSREVDWYSSTFGLATITGQAASAVAFLIVVLALLQDAPPLRLVSLPDHVHDLGNLLLTVTVLWAYVTFAQYLVIWMGNMQEDNIWYHHRTHGGWQWVGTALIVLHFAVPFFLLLMQGAKRKVRLLACIAGGVLFMRLVDNLWLVAPSSPRPEPRGMSWIDFVTPIGVGGIWVAYWIGSLARHPLIPLGYRTSTEPLKEEHGRADEPSRSLA